MILIAEDNVLIAMTMEDDLVDAGFEVVGPAPTCAAAERLARENEVSLALVDIDLARGDSGLDLAGTLNGELGVPCLFVTGQSLDAARNVRHALGVLRKPFDGKQLVAAVRAALDTPPDARPDVERVDWFQRS